jgi:Tubulin-tyrosine ligase family
MKSGRKAPSITSVYMAVLLCILGMTTNFLASHLHHVIDDLNASSSAEDTVFEGPQSDTTAATTKTETNLINNVGGSHNHHPNSTVSPEDLPTETGIPVGLFEWELPPNVTAEVCSTSASFLMVPKVRQLFPEGTFRKVSKYDIVDGTDSCEDSAVRILWDEYAPEKKAHIREEVYTKHKSGQQLTATVYNSQIDKKTLFDLIKNSTDPEKSVLRNSIPETKGFETEEACHKFCQDQADANQLNKWIWKPVFGGKGEGISIEFDVESCKKGCLDQRGRPRQAQEFQEAMTTTHGHKFDVRSFMLVANVDPLIVFSGGEYAKTCAEPINATNPVPYKNATNATWNPFQHLCNACVSQNHPTFSFGKFVSTLEDYIPDTDRRERLLKKMDDASLELAELLRPRWEGKLGHFHLFAIDYLIDTEENVYFLEVNKQPGVRAPGHLIPQLWADMFRVEWAVFSHLANITQPSTEPNLERRIMTFLPQTLFRLLKV